MDVFDQRIFSVLRDGEPKYFEQILSEVDLYNTLRQHLDKLIYKGMVESSIRPKKGPGRPRFVYSLSGDVDRQALSALLDPYKGLIVLSYDRLRRLCSHEKDGYCKEVRGRCMP